MMNALLMRQAEQCMLRQVVAGQGRETVYDVLAAAALFDILYFPWKGNEGENAPFLDWGRLW